MQILLLSTIIITIITYFFSKKIHQYNTELYSASIVVVFFTTSHIPNIINTGYIPLSFFIVTMFIGILDKGPLKKRLFTARAELAIIGSILMFPHAYGYLEFYYTDYSLLGQNLFFYMGILAYLIMLPLMITSFQKIRRKLGFKKWKLLHRSAYLFFILAGIHVILIDNDNAIYYLGIFGFYVFMKVISMMETLADRPIKKTPKKISV
jgi:sulfoxide reductase heme-binding subunit YedZ